MSTLLTFSAVFIFTHVGPYFCTPGGEHHRGFLTPQSLRSLECGEHSEIECFWSFERVLVSGL